MNELTAAGAAGASGASGPAGDRDVGRPWLLGYALAWFGYWLVIMLPPQFMAPHLIEHIAPHHKVDVLSYLMIQNSLVVVVCVPLAGRACDRTRSRFGRRRIWALGGFAVAAVPFALIGLQTSWPAVAALMVVASVGESAVLAALSAVIADRVPPRRRGAASAAMGVPQVVALVVGMVLVTMLVTSVPASWALIAVLAAASPLPFFLVRRRAPLPRSADAAPGDGERVPLPRPRAHPDYYWALLSRVLINAGNLAGTTYLLYFLDDVLHRRDPDGSLLILTLVYLVCCAATGYLGGRASDLLGRRRDLLALAGGLQAAAAALLAAAPAWPSALAGAVLLGAGYGAFLSVDQALVTDVLPDQRSRARDLGVINSAQNVPLAFGVSWLVLTFVGGYRALYAVAAVIMLLGSAAVYRIRSVR
ncbi:MFS transporter [Actinomadura verrucosospora]|uniref:MFS transporter n=1 Tax=Actinomadura verrucosospora TaxID=46165 RepID=A0A7D4A640_ACTVE|nr:MFS transporter [Actinomadura verrucosospora]QKG21887.1 MFS transporter [Actinomadura verrucosospora]